MLQIICMLPDIDGKNGAVSLLQRAILIGCCHNFQSAAIVYQPGISRSKYRKCSFFKCGLKIIEVSKIPCKQPAEAPIRPAAAGIAQARKKEAMIVNAARIISHLGLKLLRQSARRPDQLLKRKPLQPRFFFSTAFNWSIYVCRCLL